MHCSALQPQIVKVYGQLLHVTASFYYFHTIYWLSRCLHTEATQIKEKQFFFFANITFEMLFTMRWRLHVKVYV